MDSREQRLWALAVYWTVMFTLAFKFNPYMMLIMVPVAAILMHVSEELE